LMPASFKACAAADLCAIGEMRVRGEVRRVQGLGY
jgi:hypothetical protein